MTMHVAKGKGKDLAAFRSAHDKSFIVPKKIKEALEALGDSWEYEGDLIRRCGLSQIDFANYRDHFSEHWFLVGGKSPKRIWAGTKKFCDSLREKVD